MLFWFFIVFLLSCFLVKKLYTYFANRRQALNHVLFYCLKIYLRPTPQVMQNPFRQKYKQQYITFHSVACYELQKY